jgi:nitroimidazol reductase NimA-like FMN-containing flavoprotein (pyridoxamine 5'-phosphate oxidase superfamily)
VETLRLEPLGRSECLELLTQVSVGRIGLSVAALPVILPVHFALDEEAILFRAFPGTKLAVAVAAAVVAFEVDSFASDGSTGWSVLAVGKAEEIIDPSELHRANSMKIGPRMVGDRSDHFVRIETSLLSGRRSLLVADPDTTRKAW